MSSSLRITEIFYSLQGEAQSVGRPTVFVRLTGCPLRCVYCDSEYAFHGGEQVTLQAILDKVGSYQTPDVCVTGGEPLAQPAVLELMAKLCDSGKRVSLETSGALDIGQVDERVAIVMDLKAPSSGESQRNRYENIALLKASDQVKFVIGDRQDYEWARLQIQATGLCTRVAEVLLSPSYQQLPAARLASWIIEDQLPVRFQIQLHKYLWGEQPGV